MRAQLNAHNLTLKLIMINVYAYDRLYYAIIIIFVYFTTRPTTCVINSIDRHSKVLPLKAVKCQRENKFVLIHNIRAYVCRYIHIHTCMHTNECLGGSSVCR